MQRDNKNKSIFDFVRCVNKTEWVDSGDQWPRGGIIDYHFIYYYRNSRAEANKFIRFNATLRHKLNGHWFCVMSVQHIHHSANGLDESIRNFGIGISVSFNRSICCLQINVRTNKFNKFSVYYSSFVAHRPSPVAAAATHFTNKHVFVCLSSSILLALVRACCIASSVV